MALADALAAAVLKPGTRCTIGSLYDRLTPDDAATLTAWLAAPMSATTIVRALRIDGHEVTRSPLERHRRGECACGPR